jgi:hypothetical protein
MVAGLGLMYWMLPIELRPAEPPKNHPTPPAVLTLEAVQSLSQLATTKLFLHQEARIESEGWLGELTVRWDGTGSVLLGPDLARARIVDQDNDRRVATIILPQPTILAATLDLQNGWMTAAFDGLWQLTPSESLQSRQQAALLAQAQERLRQAVTPEQINTARTTAEAAVRGLGQSLQWDLQVQWEMRPVRATAMVARTGQWALV